MIKFVVMLNRLNRFRKIILEKIINCYLKFKYLIIDKFNKFKYSIIDEFNKFKNWCKGLSESLVSRFNYLTDKMKEFCFSLKILQCTIPILKLKNRYKGKRCFIVGSAPSLSSLDLSKLNNEYTFTVGRGYLLRDKGLAHSNFHVLSDTVGYEEFKNEIDEKYSDIFFAYSGINFVNQVKERIFFNYNRNYELSKSNFQTNLLKPLFCSQTVVHLAIQIAYYLGFSDIVLIGVDLDFKQNAGHVYKSSEGEKERQITHSIVENSLMLAGIDFSAKFLMGNGVNIYNASPKGIVNCMPRINYNEIGFGRDFALEKTLEDLKWSEIPKFTEIRLESTNLCGYKCFCCPRVLMKRKKGTMALADFKFVLNKLSYIKWPVEFSFHGYGEPLLIKDLPLRLKLLKKKIPSAKAFIITTLGYKVSENYLESLFKNGLEKIWISLYAYNRETYKKTHGRDSFDLVVKNLQTIIKLKKKYNFELKLQLDKFEDKHVIDESKNAVLRNEFIEQINDFGVKKEELLFQKIHNFGNTNFDFKIWEKPEPCCVTWGNRRTHLVITWDLDIVPCSYDYDANVVWGNLKKQSLKEIFSGSKRKDFFEEILTRNYTKHPMCLNCFHQGYGDYKRNKEIVKAFDDCYNLRKEYSNQDYIQNYIQLHSEDKDYGASSIEYFEEVCLFIDYLKPKTILDFGCGKGSLINKIQQKYPQIKCYKYDPAVLDYNELDVDKVDMVINTDVLEHVPEYMIQDVIKKIAQLSQNVFFALHHALASQILPNGENAHCTVKPAQWYHELMSNHFAKIVPLKGSQDYLSTVITFEAADDVVNKYLEITNKKCRE